MKTRCKAIIRAARYSIGGAVCAGAVMLISSSAQAQNLFVANAANGTITQITPGGEQSAFASGLSFPLSLAFDSQGDLFEADEGSGNIDEFTSSGGKSA